MGSGCVPRLINKVHCVIIRTITSFRIILLIFTLLVKFRSNNARIRDTCGLKQCMVSLSTTVYIPFESNFIQKVHLSGSMRAFLCTFKLNAYSYFDCHIYRRECRVTYRRTQSSGSDLHSNVCTTDYSDLPELINMTYNAHVYHYNFFALRIRYPKPLQILIVTDGFVYKTIVKFCTRMLELKHHTNSIMRTVRGAFCVKL